jgi:hypothetical protein
MKATPLRVEVRVDELAPPPGGAWVEGVHDSYRDLFGMIREAERVMGPVGCIVMHPRTFARILRGSPLRVRKRAQARLAHRGEFYRRRPRRMAGK